jgi:environmental stress-induced protein Ves
MDMFNAARLAATPWKNGGGVTREVVTRPPGANLDTFAWRVSIANVSSDGPFSVFPGVDRVLMLLDGNGVALRTADGRAIHRLDEAFVPFAFSGDVQITSSLLFGPCVDFNVMTRRGVMHADVRVVREGASVQSSDSGVLFAVRGNWRAQSVDSDSGDREFPFTEGDGCWWDQEPCAWRIAADSADAILIAVGVRPA